MGVFLESVEIYRFKGVNVYSIDNFGRWTSITGQNSTSKSSIIEAISFLGSNRMHELSDVPSWFRSSDVNREEVPVNIKYVFRLDQKFDDLMSNDRITEILSSIYETQLNDFSQKNGTDSHRKHIETSLNSLRHDGPLKKIMGDALYQAIRRKIEGSPNYEPYLQLFHPNGHFKMPEEIFNEVNFLQINIGLSLTDGPNYNFCLLNEKKDIIVSNEAFFHWFDQQNVFNDYITFGFVIGAVFIKSTFGSPYKNPEESIPTVLTSDGSNIKQYIEYCLAYHPTILGKVVDYSQQILGYSIEFKKDSLNVDEIITKIEKNEYWVPIDKLSDGMLNLIRILLQLSSSNKGDILIIDEPELHLHPSASKKLRHLIFERKNDIQILCATHSPIFLDPSFIDTIILNQNSNGNIESKIIESKHVDLALSELGSSGLDALLYDVIIWVEGHSDKIYIEKWLELMAIELKIPQDIFIGVLIYGGKSQLKHLKLDEIKLINRKSVFIIDSDKKSEGEVINRKTSIFKSNCENNGIYCWVTERREIENYIPTTILEKLLLIKTGSLVIAKYDDFFEKLKEKNRGGNSKIELANKVAPLFTIDHIIDSSDFFEELKHLFENLNVEI